MIVILYGHIFFKKMIRSLIVSPYLIKIVNHETRRSSLFWRVKVSGLHYLFFHVPIAQVYSNGSEQVHILLFLEF
jgi:hypothetical protein